VYSLAYEDNAPVHPTFRPNLNLGTIERDNAVAAAIETDLLAKLRRNVGTADRGRTMAPFLQTERIVISTVMEEEFNAW